MHYYDELIRELSELYGILPEYWDIFGKKHTTSLDTKKAVLRAMNLKIDSADDIVKEIKERKSRPWKTFVEHVHVLSVNEQPFSIPVYIPVEEREETELVISWSIEDEKGQKTEFKLAGEAVHISEQQWIDGGRYIKVNLSDRKRRDIGYYALHVLCRHPHKIFPGSTDTLHKRSKIIITPDTCYIPPELQNGRSWGLSVNLYSIRSEQNWGIGDFADLKKIIRWTADFKGGFTGINPLHAIPNSKPYGVSPYAPLSRLYKNFIYLDMENIPEVEESEDALKIMKSEDFNNELHELRKTGLIDYERAASLKEKILRKAFDFFYRKHFLRNTRRGKEFRKYITEEGMPLEGFATYMALYAFFKGRGARGTGEGKNKLTPCYSWQEWPAEYHNASSRAVQKFRKTHEKEIFFYQYVQWLIDIQLRGISEEAKNHGMDIGLYHDLAIGSVGGGSDAWSYRNVIASGADVGAPPDDFSPDGQKWGFPPAIPDKLKETGYELFIQTIRKNMKHGGALRIDHALGMFRLFWIPCQMTPKEGAYVGYQSEDLLRIIALESIRNRTMVIAEDLGTIGDNVRESLKRLRMLSYRLFYFERNYPDPSFLPPGGYPRMALCAVTTHDLPTIYGYWKGRDLKVRRQLGKYPDDTLWNKQVEERERDKGLILSALKSQGIIPGDCSTSEMTHELCRGIYQYLALTPCKLLLVSLDDIIGTIDQQNMPGTVDSHPNWIQKTPMTLEEIIKDERFKGLAETLNRYFVIVQTSSP